MSDYLYDPQPPADHTLKVPHLVFGLLFLGFAGLWALGESGAVRGEYVAVLGPAILILAGLVGLVASLASSRNRRHRARLAHHQTEQTEQAQQVTERENVADDEPTTWLDRE